MSRSATDEPHAGHGAKALALPRARALPGPSEVPTATRRGGGDAATRGRRAKAPPRGERNASMRAWERSRGEGRARFGIAKKQKRARASARVSASRSAGIQVHTIEDDGALTSTGDIFFTGTNEQPNGAAFLWIGGAPGGGDPVEPIDPISSYYASVSRMMVTGERFYPEHAMTREEALQTYTLNNAIAAFEEDIKGTLTPGKYADIVVLSQDLLTVEEDRIPDTQVDITIVGGEVRYTRGM